MKKSSLSLLSILAALALAAADGPAVDLRFLRKLTPRSTDEIGASNWRIGCETLDRDFADFEAYKGYLKPLGIKVARLQAGWAKCERRKGAYDFAWLDAIVDDLGANGIEAALETDYGNPIYEGGGDADLAGGFPTSEEALAAWDRWVEALARHFRGRVSIWMMWNEPDYSPTKPKTPAEIAAFNVRTAKVIRRVIPDARLAGLSLAKNDAKLLNACLAAMGKDVSLFDWIVYHGYKTAPEASYAEVERQKAVLRKYNPTARLWQGENGAPSELTTKFALSKIPWTEISQAKWDLRRMLGDLGHDVESSVFTICDFNHIGREINRKGLLRADEHHCVLGPKLAYFAVQNLVSVFDSTWTRDRGYRCKDPTLAAYRYQRAPDEAITVFWSVREDPRKPAFTRPGDSLETREVPRETLALPAGDLEWVDLLSGCVYALPKGRPTVPVYDSPCFVRSSSSGYSWRGFMLDEARHFFGKDVVKSYLDRMAENQMNVFHWHLTDDQGWRIDLPGFPELVKYGARRSGTPVAGSNTKSDGKPYGPFFYTPEDIREIVEYADRLGIRVVPEIEFPGHVRALLAAHPEFACDSQRITREPWCEFGVAKDVLCLGNEAAIEYCERILDQVMELFPSEFIHIGGDECPDANWQACAKCQARMKAEGLESTKALQGYFTRRIVRHVAAKGRRAIGWDEVLAGGDLPANTVIQCWRGTESGVDAARAGYEVIMSPSEWCYFTFREGLEGDPYKYRSWTKNRKLPAAKMRAFSPRANFPDELKGRVLGGECCAWSEFMYSREELEYKTLTRLPAFAAALTGVPTVTTNEKE